MRHGEGLQVLGRIDDAFDLTHPDLAANFIAGRDFVDDDNDPGADSNGILDHGTLVAKLFFHVSTERQMANLRERQADPWKRHLLSEEDVAGLGQRDMSALAAYLLGVHELVAHGDVALVR